VEGPSDPAIGVVSAGSPCAPIFSSSDSVASSDRTDRPAGDTLGRCALASESRLRSHVSPPKVLPFVLAHFRNGRRRVKESLDGGVRWMLRLQGEDVAEDQRAPSIAGAMLFDIAHRPAFDRAPRS